MHLSATPALHPSDIPANWHLFVNESRPAPKCNGCLPLPPMAAGFPYAILHVNAAEWVVIFVCVSLHVYDCVGVCVCECGCGWVRVLCKNSFATRNFFFGISNAAHSKSPKSMSDAEAEQLADPVADSKRQTANNRLHRGRHGACKGCKHEQEVNCT